MPNDLGAFVASEVARAEASLQDVRSRTLSFVSVTAGLVTLLGGAIAIAGGAHPHLSVPTAAHVCLAIALSAYVLATITALWASAMPLRVFSADPHDLSRLISDSWDAEGWDQQVAVASAEYLSDLRGAHRTLAKFMVVAAALEIVGIAFTGAVALIIVQYH
jgi:hypothetical protein